MYSRKSLSQFKPAVKRRTLLLSSALIWTLVGTMLLFRGAVRFRHLDVLSVLVVLAGLAAGSLKSKLILDRAARKGVSRILSFGDSTCLGAVYSVKTWLLVLFMMAMGGILRNSAVPVAIQIFVYLTIGWGLLLSSRIAWCAWFRE